MVPVCVPAPIDTVHVYARACNLLRFAKPRAVAAIYCRGPSAITMAATELLDLLGSRHGPADHDRRDARPATDGGLVTHELDAAYSM